MNASSTFNLFGDNAATMLGQSKTVFQAEIDAACELIDFLRFNVRFAEQILDRAPPPRHFRVGKARVFGVDDGL